MGDLHQRVVDGVDQRVERVAVGAAEREVGHVLGLERDLAADQVVEGDLAVGHPEPDDRRPTLGAERRHLLVGELAAEAVVPHDLGAGRLAPLGDLVGGAVAVVRRPVVAQPGEDVGVDLAALGLPVGAVSRRRPAGPRPSRGRASASPRAARRRTPGCCAPCRCPRSGTRTCRRGGGRRPS